ncbi:hypothetical protein Agabi119p4_1093 [Agaricus bisporus var. burnettii]|uniref:Tyr recombinase domain-containing protein n=1 Tax=Agaricus bisporus var. burnettii TaxID=192524 RepID=A0A8H7KLD9_AGABI|nr:hypothetical protein Agabi119p4_1093 [Agaricus bisporus var. burnettii]
MSEFIKPSSVESYLTGIVHYLAPVYPHIHDWRSAPVVQQTLRGCKKLHNIPVKRKRALTIHELNRMSTLYYYSKQHDDTLFVAILLVGFYALLRLGELVYPDDPTLDCPRKMSQRNTLSITAASVRFQLPYHKADKFYEGNTVLVRPNPGPSDPIRAMARYTISRDRHFPNHSDLWVRGDGSRPRRHWFLRRLHLFCDGDVAGHSLRSGGATMLAENGISLDIIQALGRWSSEAFRTYIRLHPDLLHPPLAASQHT